MSKGDDTLSKARKQIQERIEGQEKSKKIELQRRRLEIAGRGVKSYAKKNMVEAALAFKAYLSILEDLKDAPPGGLAPSHFDKKADITELVLIAGVYWDLVKLYDRTKSPDKYKEFQAYLSKYIAFTRGMPFQSMCAESMRKYIHANRALHRKEFKAAYKLISNAKCFIVTELDEYANIETLPRLRNFRDQKLKKSVMGRNLVARYYRLGPRVAQIISTWPVPLKKVIASGLNLIARISSYTANI